MTASMERLCDWVDNKDKVWVHGDRITDGHVALDMRLTPGLNPGEVAWDGQWVLRKAQPSRWVAEQHPDLSDVIPGSADGSDWSEVSWSSWVIRGLRIVTKELEPSLLTGGATHRTVVGVVMAASVGGSDAVLEAIVQDLTV
ncbi:hypothetical protein [Streptomyces sp. NPDC002790]|uniref:hypothetical protein n=1 Tax=Streptomyces sp. NPDC002790 TaxID=3154431 RepID=UPI0033244180